MQYLKAKLNRFLLVLELIIIYSKQSIFKKILIIIFSLCFKLTFDSRNTDFFNIQITLPDDYINPLSAVEQTETLLKFTNKAYHCLPDFSIKVTFICFKYSCLL